MTLVVVDELLEALRLALCEPELVDVERWRGERGTTWVLVVPCSRCGSCDHVVRRRMRGATLRNPRRLQQWLRVAASSRGLEVPVASAELGRVLVRLMHDYVDRKDLR